MKYKLHLTDEQLELMKDVMESYDWLCDCPDFPNCDDFKLFQRLKKRIDTLDERSFNSRIVGRQAHWKLKNKYFMEGANLGIDIAKESMMKEKERNKRLQNTG